MSMILSIPSTLASKLSLKPVPARRLSVVNLMKAKLSEVRIGDGGTLLRVPHSSLMTGPEIIPIQSKTIGLIENTKVLQHRAYSNKHHIKTPINPLILKSPSRKLEKLSSGSQLLSTITSELRRILHYIWRKVVGIFLINISQSNIFLTRLLPAIFHQNCQAAFGCCEYQWVKQVHTTGVSHCRTSVPQAGPSKCATSQQFYAQFNLEFFTKND